VAEKTKIIAEIGENHYGVLNIALAMLEAAAQNGADIVKFQSYLPETFDPKDSEYNWFCKVVLPDEKHFEYKQRAEELGVEFMSAPFSPERAEFLCSRLKCRSIKIASGVMLNFEILDLVNSHASAVKNVYLSTGMAAIDEIHQALTHLDKIDHVSILHCVSQYPTPPELANLAAISTLKREFPKNAIGYSDHTVGLNACRTAAALGATVLEKHFTFSCDLPGDDHAGAMPPQGLAQLREDVDQIQLMLGLGTKAPCEEELKIRDMVRARFSQ